MNKTKRFISMLISFLMVLTSFNFAFALPDYGQALVSSQELSESIEGSLESKQLFQNKDGKLKSFNFGDYKLNKGNLNETLEKRNNANKNLSEEEQQYVEDVVTALSKPIGAIDIDGYKANQTINIVVWLQQLPTALKDAYEISPMRKDLGYESLGAQARERIKSQYSNMSVHSTNGQSRSAITFEYSVVFSGFAMTVTAAEANKIANMPGVYAVTPDTLMYTDSVDLDPNYIYDGMGASREVLQIGKIHEAGITGNGVIVGVLDTGIDHNHPDLAGVFKGGWNYIQPSVDYGRPEALKNSPMETTYEQWQASGQAEVNDRGSSFYTDHGTHVSGTIAARAKNDASGNYKALGLAPNVELYVARVLGPYGSGATTGIIAAIEDFASGKNPSIPKADVINLSLGAANNYAYGDDVFALNNAVIAGVNVSVSAGNNATGAKSSKMADRKIQTLGSPGVAYLPVTVAASQYGGETVKSYDNVTATAAGFIEAYNFGLLVEGKNPNNTFLNNAITGDPSPIFVEDKGYEVHLGFDLQNDKALEETEFVLKFIGTFEGGSPIKDADGNITNIIEDPAKKDILSGKVLVVKRGINFNLYKQAALHTGAGALIVINNDGEDRGERYITNMSISGTAVGSLPIFSAFHSTSGKLAELAELEETVYLQLGELSKEDQLKYPAYFSSIGPVNPVAGLKPDIIAPGWDIISTAPAYIVNPDHNSTDYSVAYQGMSGTSMSAPHMAGILALMVEKYPDATPAEIKARLMNTSEIDFIKTTDDKAEYGASVLEVGAGFVNPYRAIIEEATRNVFITVQDDIPGLKKDEDIKNQTLSSLSFGFAEKGQESRRIPLTINGLGDTTDYAVSVVYNDNTRYSKNATANNVVVEFDTTTPSAIEAYVSVPAEAEDGYYEGYIVVDVEGIEYTLPWLVQVGDALPPPPPFGNLLFTSQRPIISTSEDLNIRSIGGESPLNSSITSLYFAWEGAWPTDSAGYSDLDLFLIKPESIGPNGVNLDYYFGYVTIDGLENDGTAIYRIDDFITSEAYKIVDGDLGDDLETIENGAYYVAVIAGDEIYVYNLVGVVFTDGTGDYEVQFNIDEELSVYQGSPTVKVTGNIYSPALEAAAEAGFAWTDAQDFWTKGNAWIIDQSFNTLAYGTADPIAAVGTRAYNLVVIDGGVVECDENGDFDIIVPIAGGSPDGGYVFNLEDNHTVVGVEGFYLNRKGASVALIGANKSEGIEPLYNYDWWSFDEGTGTLSINTAGDMPNFAFDQQPWHSVKSQIVNVIIENEVTNIGDRAFNNCSNLVNVSIPNTVTKIGAHAFSGCSKLVTIAIPESIQAIGISAFYECLKLKNVNIPDGVTEIGYNMFANCEVLESIILPNSVVSIGTNAFDGCYELSNVVLSDNLQTIGAQAFLFCDSLENIVLPESLITIGSESFKYAPITSINIPANVTSIGNSAFEYCDSLASINVAEDNTVYASEDGVLFNKAMEELICFPSGKGGDYTVPNTVNSIYTRAFSSNSKITNVVLLSGVTKIGELAFNSCENLASISIPTSLETIMKSAFEDCDKLADVYYQGSEVGWSSISIEQDNEPLTNATIHFAVDNTALASAIAIADEKVEDDYTEESWEAFVEALEAAKIVNGNIHATQEEVDNALEALNNAMEALVVVYTITFNSNGGSYVESIKVVDGLIIPTPADPTREGYTFLGWYKDAELTTPWNFENDVVTEDITLYASWDKNADPEPTKYTVTFNSNGGTPVSSIEVTSGSAIIAPTTTREDYAFTGWYKDAELTAKWDFDEDVVTGDITLYAGWRYVGGSVDPNPNPDPKPNPNPNPTPTPEPTPEPTPDEPVEFIDIVNHWAKNDIEFIAGLGLVNGTGEGIFSPETLMNRGMIVTVLGRLANVDENDYSDSSSFSDVAAGQYYARFVEWAAQLGIVNGTGNGNFSPDAPLTREQLVHMLMNYAKAMNLNLEANEENNVEFVDAENISAWASESVQMAKELGIVVGNPNGAFEPQRTITRAEVITMLARFIRLIEQ